MTDYLYTAGQLRRHARVCERPEYEVPTTLPFLLQEAADLLEQAEKEAQLRAKREMREAGGGKMSEPKPCPFCGGEAKLKGGNVVVIPLIDENGAYIDADDFYVEPSFVECTKCHASGETFYDDDDAPTNAIEAWNRRTNDYAERKAD